MTLREQYICKRQALGMSLQEFAAIADVSEGIMSLFEKGERVDPIAFAKIKYNVENYIRAFDRKKYLTTRIIEETLMLHHRIACGKVRSAHIVPPKPPHTYIVLHIRLFHNIPNF